MFRFLSTQPLTAIWLFGILLLFVALIASIEWLSALLIISAWLIFLAMMPYLFFALMHESIPSRTQQSKRKRDYQQALNRLSEYSKPDHIRQQPAEKQHGHSSQ